MSLDRLLTETVAVVRVVWDAVDRYGNPRPGTTTQSTYLGRVELAENREVVDDRQTIVTTWRLFLPPTAVIRPLDRVESGGRTFEVDGEPIVHRTPAGPHHIEARLRDVEG